MAKIIRKSEEEKISGPEQLEKSLVVTSPLSWIALLAVTAAIIAVVIWSFVGKIPVTVSATGYVVKPAGANAVYAEENGKVIAVMVYEDQILNSGDVILTYQVGNREIRSIVSDQIGQVAKVCVKAGDSLGMGDEVVRVTPNIDKQCVVCYMPKGDAKKVEQSMKAGIYLSSADSQTYGHMEGVILSIDSLPATEAGKIHVLGDALASKVQGSYWAVTLYLRPDPSTASGYYWTNEKGKNVNVSNSSEVTVKIAVEEIHPIEKLSAKLEEIWGD